MHINQYLQGPWPFQNPVITAHVISADSNVKTDESCVLVHTGA